MVGHCIASALSLGRVDDDVSDVSDCETGSVCKGCVACVKAVLLCKGCVAVRRGGVMVDRVFCAACAIRGVRS